MTVDIIGRGNVATHLFKAFSNENSSIDVNLVNPHTLENLRSGADVILISVKDDAISEVAGKLSECSGVIAHTSGSTTLEVIQNELLSVKERCGVFYPLQTFTKNVELNYEEIPIFIEGGSERTEKILTELAGRMSHSIQYANSEKRKVIHISSVLACNFANHLWGLSNDILRDNNIDIDVIFPLVKETLRKAIESKEPHKVQTGPASRHDEKIISAHLKFLEKYPQTQLIYKTLTDSIQKCQQ